MNNLGLPRLLDYAFGGQPWIAEPAHFRLRADLAGERLQVRFNRRVAGTSELTYTAQMSPDLVDWSSLAPSFVTAAPLPGLPGFEEAVYQTDGSLPERQSRFMRVHVALP